MELYNLEGIPNLDIGRREGSTGYIDFLKWDEVTEPVMKGMDLYGRRFVVVKMNIENEDINFMETYFQRYSDLLTKWMSCGHATRKFINTIGTGLDSDQIDLLKRVINKEEVIIEDIHRPWREYYEGKKVKLYENKKEKAAIIIQKQWRKCRYDPSYEMCKRVQMNNQKSILERGCIIS